MSFPYKCIKRNDPSIHMYVVLSKITNILILQILNNMFLSLKNLISRVVRWQWVIIAAATYRWNSSDDRCCHLPVE